MTLDRRFSAAVSCFFFFSDFSLTQPNSSSSTLFTMMTIDEINLSKCHPSAREDLTRWQSKAEAVFSAHFISSSFPFSNYLVGKNEFYAFFSSFLFHWIKKNKTKSRLVTHTEFFTRRAKKSWQIISCLSQQFSIKSTPSLMQRGDSAERLCIWFVRSCLDEERIEKWAFTAAIAISYKFFLPLNLSLFSSFSAVWCCLVLFTYS